MLFECNVKYIAVVLVLTVTRDVTIYFAWNTQTKRAPSRKGCSVCAVSLAQLIFTAFCHISVHIWCLTLVSHLHWFVSQGYMYIYEAISIRQDNQRSHWEVRHTFISIKRQSHRRGAVVVICGAISLREIVSRVTKARLSALRHPLRELTLLTVDHGSQHLAQHFRLVSQDSS